MTVATISRPVAHGIRLGAGNYGLTLTVAGGGAVQGTGYAVYGPSLSSNEMVVNGGLIAATGYGIFLESQGSLLNAGSVSGGNRGSVMCRFGPLEPRPDGFRWRSTHPTGGLTWAGACRSGFPG